MANLRRNYRIDCSIPVLLFCPAREKQESWGVIYNISMGGVKIETPLLLDKNEEVFLSFMVGKKFHFKRVRGTVIRVLLRGHTYEVGIKFDSIENKQLMIEAIQSIEDYK
ncbi:MAG: PilZ domain-containing protein [Endomicrobiales bacterium]|nr:PilZ domain-containing protein [Endomicrobiales bacterium]